MKLDCQDDKRSLVAIYAAREALGRDEWAAVFQHAGQAILFGSGYREPYCLIAEAAFMQGDAIVGETYLQLAEQQPRRNESVPDEAVYDAVTLAARAAQWREHASQIGNQLSILSQAPPKLRLAAGGDVLLARQMPGWVAMHGADRPLRAIAPMLKAADLALVNLETCVSAEGDFIDKGGRQPYYYRCLPDMLEVLAAAGIGCLAAGNNHAMDFGPQALAQQSSILDACGFLHFGAGRTRTEAAQPRYVRVGALTVAFIGCETETPCMAAGDAMPGVLHAPVAQLDSLMAGSIAVARAHADLVIVSPHWGANWEEAPSPALRAAARRLIDLGADAILGHSAHILQGMEMHAGRPIVYDMGTLLFDRVGQHRMKESALFGVEWSETGNCRLTALPLLLAPGCTYRAAGDASRRILERLKQASLALDARSTVESVGVGLRLEAHPPPSPVRQMRKRSPAQPHDSTTPQHIPSHLQQLRSNLVYSRMPEIEGLWPTPVRLPPGVEVLGARYASPVRPGRGFVCEVYFRAAAPAVGSRIEARLACLDAQGVEQYAYLHPVAEGVHPPARWQYEEIICDRVVVRPRKRLPEGRYRLYWSLVDRAQETSPPAANEGNENEVVELGEWVVDEAAPGGVGGIAPPLRLPRAEHSGLEIGEHRYERAKTDQDQRFATPDNPLLLSAARMASVTNGVWQHPPADTALTGFSFRQEYLTEGSSGNIFLALNPQPDDPTFDAKSAQRVVNALAAGAVAAVVPKTATGLPDALPLLRVDNVMQALERMGLYVRDQLFRGKRVLISGTEGKTGCKHMLHHVLAPQIPMHAIINSSNLTYSALASLASLRRGDQVAVIEAAGTNPGRLAERSRLVKPHLAILTEVGNEHLNYHGNQQGVIESKADIVTGLVEGGIVLLNADSENYAAVRKSALARRHIPLALFGTGAGCNGRLLERRFSNGVWTVSADIEGRRIDYSLPLLGEHAPLASVGVLLAAFYLDADVAQAAARFADYRPYWSEGVLRRIAHRNGELRVYDNTWKSSVLGYRSALRTFPRLAPPAPTGRRIGLIGEMIYLGQEAERWHATLAEWIDAAGFDALILVGKQTETSFANLKNPSIVAARFPDYDRRTSGRKALQGIIDAIEATCAPGDLLFVKGEFDELGDYLRAREITDPAAPRRAPSVSASPAHEEASALAGLRRIELDDLPRYRAVIDESERSAWHHYFPFLYLYDRAAKHEHLLIDEDAGSLCIYRVRRRAGKEEMSLFLLPLPFQPAVFERCLERLRDFNRSESASVFRVDAEDAARLRQRASVRCVACPDEYVYAPTASLDLRGNKKGNLRRAIRTLRERADFEICAYDPLHADECRALFDVWASLQESKYGEIRYRGYTFACLDHYAQFPRTDLFGKVIRLEGKICGFGFGGEASRRMGNIFIVYSDLRIDGLSKCLYQSLLEEMRHLPFANASHGAETPGLAFAKAAFGPALLHRPYQLYLD